MMKRNALLLPIGVIQLFLLLPLAWWVRSHPVNQMDITITRSVQHFQSPLLSALGRLLAFLCSWETVTALTFPVALLLWKARQRAEAVTIVSVALLGTMFRKGLQRLIGRPRPRSPLVHVTKEKKSASFPSGHATTALAGWGWLLVIIAEQLKGRPTWRNVALGMLLPVLVLA